MVGLKNRKWKTFSSNYRKELEVVKQRGQITILSVMGSLANYPPVMKICCIFIMNS
jgi:hypothetical protein